MRAPFVTVTIAGLVLAACGATEPAGGAVPPHSDVSVAPPGSVPSMSGPSTTDASGTIGSNGPHDPSAELRSDLMVVTPSVAEPGHEVAVTYPGGRERGLAYVLERSTGTDSNGAMWDATHLMTATTEGYGSAPSWRAYGDGEYDWEDVGFDGPGPDTLVVPDTALPGAYRICTGNSAENICAEVTIVPVTESAGPFDAGTSAPVAALLGLSVAEFEERVAELGFGPVRIAWRDGEFLPVDQDLQPGRVYVAVERRGDVDIVVDARVEADTETGALGPEATIVEVQAGVRYYPACGNEQLDDDGVVWYPVQEYEYPEIYDRAARGARETPPESIAPRGLRGPCRRTRPG